MANFRLVILLVILLFEACSNDLDESGFVRSKYNAQERFAQSHQFNQIHGYRSIVADSSTYRIIFCGDTHIGTHVHFDSILKAARIDRATALIVAGDITRGHPENYDTLNALMSGTDSVNWFFTTGNHDLYFGSWPLFFQYFGASSYYFTVQTSEGSDLFIILDSGSGTLGSDQLNWLSETLANFRPTFRNCFVATHLNIFKDGLGMSTNLPPEELYVLLDLFAENNVSYVVSGHDHSRYESQLGPTKYIIMDHCRDDENGASFMTLTVSPESISHEFTPLN